MTDGRGDVDDDVVVVVVVVVVAFGVEDDGLRLDVEDGFESELVELDDREFEEEEEEEVVFEFRVAEGGVEGELKRGDAEEENSESTSTNWSTCHANISCTKWPNVVTMDSIRCVAANPRYSS